MKKVRLSLSGIFQLIGAGVILTTLVLCIGVFLITQNGTTVIHGIPIFRGKGAGQ